jgi:hypothetical protein
MTMFPYIHCVRHPLQSSSPLPFLHLLPMQQKQPLLLLLIVKEVMDTASKFLIHLFDTALR